MTFSTERVPFRFLIMPCCQHQVCWVNPRYPNYCPECGKHIYPDVRSCATIIDNNATLKIHIDENNNQIDLTELR